MVALFAHCIFPYNNGIDIIIISKSKDTEQKSEQNMR